MYTMQVAMWPTKYQIVKTPIESKYKHSPPSPNHPIPSLKVATDTTIRLLSMAESNHHEYHTIQFKEAPTFKRQILGRALPGLPIHTLDILISVGFGSGRFDVGFVGLYDLVVLGVCGLQTLGNALLFLSISSRTGCAATWIRCYRGVCKFLELRVIVTSTDSRTRRARDVWTLERLRSDIIQLKLIPTPPLLIFIYMKQNYLLRVATDM